MSYFINNSYQEESQAIIGAKYSSIRINLERNINKIYQRIEAEC